MKMSRALAFFAGFAVAALVSPPASAGTLALLSPSTKVCQLTGQDDWDSHLPTAARTFSNFGLDSVDLGFPVDSGRELYFLFGDSFPLTHGPSTVPPDDALGFTTRTAPPDPSTCLDLQLAISAPQKFAHPTVTPAIQQGSFNVPSGGIFLDGTIYGFFWTDHCIVNLPLTPLPLTPIAYPPVTAQCKQIPANNSIGSSVLAWASPTDPVAFHRCGFREIEALRNKGCPTMPSGFVYVSAALPNEHVRREVIAREAPGIPVVGVARYRASIPYLAIAPRATFADPNTWSFFAGLSGGTPTWVTRAVWESGHDASGNWLPPSGAELYDASPAGERCVGEHSLAWSAALGTWLFVYNCAPWTVEVRTAPEPWGPWSQPTVILQATPGSPLVCTLIMSFAGCPGKRNYWPGMPGIFYAPFVLSRYTQDMTPPGSQTRQATVYWLLSTWNPYQVTVMQSSLQFTP